MVSTHILQFRRDSIHRQSYRRFRSCSTTHNPTNSVNTNQLDRDQEKRHTPTKHDDKAPVFCVMSESLEAQPFHRSKGEVESIPSEQEIVNNSSGCDENKNHSVGSEQQKQFVRPSVSPRQMRPRSQINHLYVTKKRSIFRHTESSPKVSFSDSVKVKFIPFYYEYGVESLQQIWWSRADYQQFQEIAIKFVQIYGSLKHIEEEDVDESSLILKHKECKPDVTRMSVQDTECVF
mmetsp:Transcript_30917/g.40833  ORF Transcript_30917/g.40833 Transcript_30917/m.40833 type:complete len:234 (-) Transcript_30917:454-1155(-)